ncbi:MAG: stage V sporulation protein B [Bacilli bacterium]
MTKQSFLKGTFILIIAGLFTRILGFINRIVVARVMGSEGVGLYMMAVPTLLLVITLTQLGIPVAVSKLVAEAEANDDQERIKKIVSVSLLTTGVLSIVFTVAVAIAAPVLSQWIFTDERTLYPLLAIIPVVPIIAISSVIRGYFQGKHDMRPGAYSQLLEQVVRIFFVYVCTSAFLPYGVEFAAAGAMLSGVIGEFASLLYLIYLYEKKKSIQLRTNFFGVVRKSRDVWDDIMRVALPTTGSRFIGSVSLFLEPVVVAQCLLFVGMATSEVTKQYGLLNGYAVPMLLLPSFITYAVSVSLVPAISEAYAKGNKATIALRINQALRLSMLSGGWSIVVLYVFSDPLMQLMYHSTEASHFVRLMAPFFLFFYFQGPLQSVLQALDFARAAMMNSLVGSVVKVIFIAILTLVFPLGMEGVAMAIVASMLAVTLLHYTTVRTFVKIGFSIREWVVFIISTILSGVVGIITYQTFIHQMPTIVATLGAITVSSVVYLFLMLLCRFVSNDELRRIPYIGKLF